jgi:isopentenyl-diphosphate delta-isomerase
MPEVAPIGNRKNDHIRINLEEDVNSGRTTGLERYHFINRALPELDLEMVDLSQELFGRFIRSPILISSMTGGIEQARLINQRLAQAAQHCGIALGVGSQRAALEKSEFVATFQVRQYAPDILLLANLGAVQLNYGFGIEQCRTTVDMIQADALILHLNALQEAVQPEGETRFAGLAKRIEQICRNLQVPVIVKEVGWGFSEEDVRLLKSAGVAAIDVAGAGGTSWSQVEMHRARTESHRRLAAAFVDWGIPTSQAILNVRKVAPEQVIFASGGLRNGVDIAKCIALGARLGGMAGPFLKAAVSSLEDVIETIEVFRREIQVCMFAAGVSDLEVLRQTRLQEDN